MISLCAQDKAESKRKSPSSLDDTANEMKGEQGKNNRYFGEQFKGLYVHVDEKEKNGSVTATDHLQEKELG